MLVFNGSEFHVLVQLSKFKNIFLRHLLSDNFYFFSLRSTKRVVRLKKSWVEKKFIVYLNSLLISQFGFHIHFVFALKTDGHTGVRSRISDLIRYTTKGFI